MARIVRCSKGVVQSRGWLVKCPVFAAYDLSVLLTGLMDQVKVYRDPGFTESPAGDS